MVPSLTAYEAALVRDSQVLLTKNVIIQKVYELFGSLASNYQLLLHDSRLGDLGSIPAKISRGENYRGLPYVMLDYPRIFSKENSCAIRTFFWWGNFFSITLQLSGKYQQHYAPQLAAAIERDLFAGWSIGQAADRWEHHFESNNYASLGNGQPYALEDLPFLKLAKKIPLEKWDEAENFFKENVRFLVNLLGI